jgi:hypothetical protein
VPGTQKILGSNWLEIVHTCTNVVAFPAKKTVVHPKGIYDYKHYNRTFSTISSIYLDKDFLVCWG